jgi:hypothetical protein
MPVGSLSQGNFYLILPKVRRAEVDVDTLISTASGKRQQIEM